MALLTRRVVLLLCLSVPAWTQENQPPAGVNLDTNRIASGLKEALEVSAKNTVNITGRVDGYLKNEAIKILLPPKVRQLEKGLRAAGMGPQIDEFEVAMNRAAEKAAPAALPIFGQAIREMTFSDARGILTGGKHAATDYFRRKTYDQLKVAFRPIVESTMQETGVVKQYNALTASGAGSLLGVFGGGKAFDITDYVVEKSLDGLFFVLGQEEEKIRTNPVARVTPLLQQVFGSH